MSRNIIPRTEYEIYFLGIDKVRPGKAAVRQYLRAHHPLYSNDFPIDRRPCGIAGKRFEMITVFARKRTLMERIFANRKTTQTQALVAHFSKHSPCIVRAPNELLVLGETPESVNLQNTNSNTNRGAPADYTITKIDDVLSAENALSSRGTVILAIAILIPVAFAIACATIRHDSPYDLKQKTQSETTRRSPAATPETIPRAHDFFSCLKADIDAVNASGGRIVSYHYDGGPTEKISIKSAGGDIATLGEALGKSADIAGLTIPGISFGNGYPECTVSYSRIHGAEKRATSLTWQTVRKLEANFAGATVKPEKIKLVPQIECSFLMEASDLPACIDSVADWCKRESLDVRTISIDTGARTSVTVAFAKIPESITIGTPDKLAIRKAFRLAAETTAKKQTAKSNTIVGKISEEGKTAFTFRKDDAGKIRHEGEMQ